MKNVRKKIAVTLSVLAFAGTMLQFNTSKAVVAKDRKCEYVSNGSDCIKPGSDCWDIFDCKGGNQIQ